MGYKNIAIKVDPVTSISGYTGTDACIKISVLGVKSDNTTAVLETFEGSSNPLANIDGESIYLENVVKSQYIDVKVFNTLATFTTSVTRECIKYDNVSNNGIKLNATIAAGVKDAYKYFRDFEISSCTLVINPFVKSTIDDYEDINNAIASLAEYRKNVLAVIGYPVNKTYVVEAQDATSNDSIKGYFITGNGGVGSDAKGNKFCIAVQGREIITLFGYRYTLNCTGGYCGKTINIAKEVHTNQVASMYIYGVYGGSLKESLLSGQVIDLMELGINSVYTSNRGNIIFGTRTMYTKQTSYFATINVMRVAAAILKNIYPICLETIHTDTAANPVSRASFSTMLNSVLSTFISKQDIMPDSKAICDDNLNTDYLTKGGRELNAILSIHFIGLTEKVNIKIIATDTSVTAEFV